ncbi:MAG TPA: TlpA family protein disulfide reductase [Gammaproteobacteria bacterium]|nr:TlpA family protein disulfide reductase [Gammaproteobacteria bacterium]
MNVWWLKSGLLIMLGVFALTLHAEQSLLTPLPDKKQAPPLVLTDIYGVKHDIRNYRGKPVIINFWATWCPPCRRELPSLNRAWKKIKGKGIVMLAVGVGEDEDSVVDFMTDNPINFTVLLDRRADVSAHWPVAALPTTFVLDKQGRLVYQAIGERQWDNERLLNKVRALK